MKIISKPTTDKAVYLGLKVGLVYKHGSYTSIQSKKVELDTTKAGEVELASLKCTRYDRLGRPRGRLAILKDVNDVEIKFDVATGEMVCNELSTAKRHHKLTGYQIDVVRTNHAS